jgi:hypothetical protein
MDRTLLLWDDDCEKTTILIALPKSMYPEGNAKCEINHSVVVTVVLYYFFKL